MRPCYGCESQNINQFLKIGGRRLLIDLLTNIIFPIRILYSNLRILFYLNSGPE